MGAAAGGMLGGTLGAALGRFAGSMLGNVIDNKLFASNSYSSSNGPRLKELHVQTSSYGITIPIIYGTVRIAGNIIWARPLTETPTTTNYNQGVKGAKIRHSHTQYAYHASFAVSICEGEIDEVVRIYAGTHQLNISQYNIRIYHGSESQNPDILIESFEGIGKTPAFRGQAYIVFENLPLAEFGNCIPNLNFEVRGKICGANEVSVRNLVKSIVMIPGGGEYVYDTINQYKSIGNYVKNQWCQLGQPQCLNNHNSSGQTNAVLATANLQKALPHLKWIAVVVNWFGTSLDIADCKILPGVEYQDNQARNHPDEWQVANFSRASAHLVSSVNNSPIYGGTINDKSLVRYIKYLKDLGYKVMLYPMIFMDLPTKPWRGHITGNARNINSFFDRKEGGGYNNFITHYANLLKDVIDAFIIGSELKSLTAIQDENNNFPAVDKFIELADTCRTILGSDTIITYAADWSEYHHTTGGWYHMDKLWAAKNIDVVGIDAYFPLTNSSQSSYDTHAIQQGWLSGEGYDYYYSDDAKTNLRPLKKDYAWKNIKWWWDNYHINPDGTKTAWVPKSKKIWFTEYGFPSVDCATNQPNVFYDPYDDRNSYPVQSKGNVDFKAQSSAIIATEELWQNSEMVANKFLWCWDARPYPQWPDLKSVWTDSNSWAKGHWIQGKINQSPLKEILRDLSAKVNLSNGQLSFEKIDDSVDGLVIDSQMSARSILELLQRSYNFDVTEKNGKINFRNICANNVVKIDYQDIAKTNSTPPIAIKRAPEIDLPHKIDVNYIDINNYQISNQHSAKRVTNSKDALSFDLPLVINQANAKIIAENFVQKFWVERNYYTFYLPPKFIDLAPSDVVTIDYHNKIHKIKILSIQIGKNHLLKIKGVNFHVPQSLNYHYQSIMLQQQDLEKPSAPTQVEILDLPYIAQYKSDQPYVLVAAKSGSVESWDGATIYSSTTPESDFSEVAYINKLAVIGRALNKPLPVNSYLVDYESKITINLEHGELLSVTANDIGRGSNLCLIGKELIQFQNAEQISKFQYRISTLYRGLHGTEFAIGSHDDDGGEKFILIDDKLLKLEVATSYINQTSYIKAITDGMTLGSSPTTAVNFDANSIKEMSPVSLDLLKLPGGQSKLSWIRRNRKNSQLVDYVDIPLENKEGKYLVHLLNDQTNIYKTFVTTTSQLILANKDLENCHSIRVCQLNDLSREGFYATMLLQPAKG